MNKRTLKQRKNKFMKRDNYIFKFTVLFFCLCFLILTSFLVGRYEFDIRTILDIFKSQFIPIEQYWETTLEVVILQVRLPRIILAALVGGALSVSGASYQTLFKNPMVSPDILGVSAGAGFGAAFAMINNGNWIAVQTSALIFGLAAVTITYLISRIYDDSSIIVMVLAGVIVSSFFQALLSIVKTLADTENELPSITFWLMGSMNKATGRDVMIMLPALAFSLLLLYFFRYQINALSAGEDVVQTMGVNVSLVKLIIIVSSTLMTVVAVSICGIIGWIGVVIPHLARMVVGADYNKMAPISFLIGGIFLLIVDDVVRGIENVELPLGVLTALIGTPVFVVLLSKAKQGWN